MEPVETRLGFDTHADVSCAGSDCYLEKRTLVMLKRKKYFPEKEKQ